MTGSYIQDRQRGVGSPSNRIAWRADCSASSLRVRMGRPTAAEPGPGPPGAEGGVGPVERVARGLLHEARQMRARINHPSGCRLSWGEAKKDHKMVIIQRRKSE